MQKGSGKILNNITELTELYIWRMLNNFLNNDLYVKIVMHI